MSSSLKNIAKGIVRRCMHVTPYELKRKSSKPKLPDATFDNVKLALAYYLRGKICTSFVQIGACDGVTGDSVNEYILKGRMKAVLVEPVDGSVRKLREVYRDVPGVTIVQAAIGLIDGETTMFKVREGGGKIVTEEWAPQLASFSREHLLKHRIQPEEIEEISVPTLTLRSLLLQQGIEQLDLLQIDTEGFDGEVVKMALTLPKPPKCINFENIHLDRITTSEVFQQLEEKGYVWTHDCWNTLALHPLFLSEAKELKQ